MHCHENLLCRYSFAGLEDSTYHSAHQGIYGKPAESCKIEQRYEPTLAVRYGTESGDNYIPINIKLAGGGRKEIRPIDQDRR